MCGLVGIAGKLELKDEKTMKRLLLIDWLRGPDSTGFAVRDKTTGEVEVLKMATHPLDFFESKKFTKMLSAYQSDVFLGHNRLATKGKVNGLNAHPFECGHIVGAHNGTLEADSWIELDELIDDTTDVDSLAIFKAIEKVGIEETIKQMYGAWALTWIDTDKGTFNAIRNGKRPLWYCYSKTMDKLMWASEWPMIRAAKDLSDNSYELWQNKEGFTYFELPEDTLYTWDLEALRDPAAKVKHKKPTIKTLKGKEPPPVKNHAGQNFTVTTPASGTSWKTNNTRIPLTGTNSDPFAGIIAIDKFKELSKYGCSYCDGPIEFEDRGLNIYTDTDQILCRDCCGHRDETKIFMCSDDFQFIAKAL